MNIKEYSAKSFVVIGEKTKEYKEDLKKIGGRYNANLSCGPGWIFPNPRKSDVVLFLNSKGFGEGITPSETKTNLPAITELESTFILVMKNLDLKERFTVLEKLVSLLKNVDTYTEVQKEEKDEKVEEKKKNKRKTPVKVKAQVESQVKAQVEVDSENEEENEPEVEVKKESKKGKAKQVEDKKKQKPLLKKVKEVSSDSEEETDRAVTEKPVKPLPAKPSKKSPKKVENDSDTSVDDDGVEIKVQPRLLPKH